MQQPTNTPDTGIRRTARATRRIVRGMSTGTASESAGSARPDRADLSASSCAHLDEDAECLEDPVHCGDARHQHDVHKAVAAAGDDAATANGPAPA